MTPRVFVLLSCAALSGACTTKLPVVDPEAFACIDDAVDDDGLPPCPDSHWCADMQCTPRMFCNVEGRGRLGCELESTRCEPVFTELTSAVRCERGVHTATSARAGAECDCADGTHCVAFAEGPAADSYPLYVVPDGGALPSLPGTTGEVADWRMCLRACSSEANCPGNHTCRVAAVSSAILRSAGSARHTVGVCFPEQIVTSSVAIEPQPIPNGCLARSECMTMGASTVCQIRVEVVAEHPLVPSGGAWANSALVGRCIEPAAGLAEDGIGCTDGRNCKSGLCVGGSCRRVCNPLTREGCPNGRCNARPVSRGAGVGTEVDDVVFICG